MAVRIRKDNKTIVCAAKSKAEDGDCYIDDGVHYCLSVELQVLHPDSNEKENGLWHFKMGKRWVEKVLDKI